MLHFDKTFILNTEWNSTLWKLKQGNGYKQKYKGNVKGENTWKVSSRQTTTSLISARIVANRPNRNKAMNERKHTSISQSNHFHYVIIFIQGGGAPGERGRKRKLNYFCTKRWHFSSTLAAMSFTHLGWSIISPWVPSNNNVSMLALFDCFFASKYRCTASVGMIPSWVARKIWVQL